MKKIVLITLGLVAIVSVGIGGIWHYYVNKYNPSYHGKRINTWADQAIWDEQPVARQEAVEVLLEALPEMEEGPKAQLLMRFCHPEKNNREKRPLPKEVIGFLIKALKLTEAPQGGYAAVALEQGAPETIPALKEAFENEQDEKVRILIGGILDRTR